MPDAPQYPGAPRWVQLAGIAAAVFVLVLIVAALVGSGHGPQRHFGRRGAETTAAPGAGR